ncbi:MAG TPA: EamA family transporter, partial [Pantoea septica]|nr:EamA family transporter [Pantoea septica]
MSLSLSGKTPAPAVSVAVLLIAMLSLQGGASLAKSLSPTVGATGITALRLGLGTLMLCMIFKPWRLRFTREQRLPLLLYGLALGCMNFLFYLALRTVPLGVAVALEFTGPLTLALLGTRRLLDFIWVVLAVSGLWFLLPFGDSMKTID